MRSTWKIGFRARSAQISVVHLFAGFPRTLRLDNASQFEESITVTLPDHQKSDWIQSKTLDFHGDFCLWSKSRLPPDVASADPATINSLSSGNDAVVMPHCASGVEPGGA